MFFTFSKIFKFLTDPLIFILLLTFIATLRCRKRKTYLIGFLFCYLIATPLVSQRLMYFLEHLQAPTYSSQKKYDAVVVLSGMLNLSLSRVDQPEFADASDRILKGIEIMREGKSDYLIISGGSGDLFHQEKSEAVILAAFSRKLGVAGDKILVDGSSKNTYQNAVNTQRLLEENKLSSVLLITSAFHMVRSNGCFQRVGIKADLLPVDFNANLEAIDYQDFIPATAALSQSNRFLHESIGILAYSISGKVKL